MEMDVKFSETNQNFNLSMNDAVVVELPPKQTIVAVADVQQMRILSADVTVIDEQTISIGG